MRMSILQDIVSTQPYQLTSALSNAAGNQESWLLVLVFANAPQSLIHLKCATQPA